MRFDLAIAEPKILNTPQDIVLQCLRFVMLKIGIRANNLPNKEETAVLLDHIYKNYSGHTIAEIKLAFDMAITGKLNVEVNCYENFSCTYFSSIMNAYREWAKETYVKKPQEMKQVIYTDDDLKNIQRADVEAFYQRLRNFKGGEKINVPKYFHDILNEDCLLKKGETVDMFFLRKLNSGADSIYVRC